MLMHARAAIIPIIELAAIATPIKRPSGFLFIGIFPRPGNHPPGSA
jgi:hypothetical protein